MPIKFEGTCWRCNARITSANGGETWRHTTAPATPHQASPSGTISQR